MHIALGVMPMPPAGGIHDIGSRCALSSVQNPSFNRDFVVIHPLHPATGTPNIGPPNG